MDSTILDDAVATQDTVTQLVSAIRRVAREVPGAAEQIAEVCTGHDYGKPGKPKIDWDDPAAKDALVSALVNDANAVVAAFRGAELEERAASALALLALVAGQDVEPAEGSDGTDGRWRIARKVAEDRVISTVDPDARHTRKSQQARRDGYRAHVAADPETGIITDEKLTRAAGAGELRPGGGGGVRGRRDRAGQLRRRRRPGAGTDGQDGAGPAGTAGGDDGGDQEDPLAWYGDTAYGTGELREAIGRRRAPGGDQAQAGAARRARRVHRDDFTVDEQAGTVTCPAGVTRSSAAPDAVIFGAACRACPLRAAVHHLQVRAGAQPAPRDDLLRAARADWAADTGLREDYTPHRPNVERVIAQVATWRGRRLKLRYRGVTRNHAWLKRRTAALNLRNLIGRGLTRRDGAWVLAT